MEIKKVYGVSFSPVQSTASVVKTISENIAQKLSTDYEAIDFTLPEQRAKGPWNFKQNELVIFGTPTYAGRIPNKALPFVEKLFEGFDTPCVAIVTFGNRNFDSSLSELVSELQSHGFRPFAAAGVASRHVFSDVLAAGRPDENDFKLINVFSDKVSEMTKNDISMLSIPVKIRNGEPVAPYYTPLKSDGTPAKFLKAKPRTDSKLCINCGTCVRVCPFGSIDPHDVTNVPGICVKCHACVRNCVKHAKYFDDPDFLSHKEYLETHFMDRKEPEFYFSQFTR